MVAQLTIVFFLMMLSVAAGATYWVWSRELVATPADQTAATPTNAGSARSWPLELPVWLRWLANLGLRVPSGAEERQRLRQDLASAGIRDDWGICAFLGSRLVAALTLPLLTGAIVYSINPNVSAALTPALLGAYLGYRLPQQCLNGLIRRRMHKIQLGLPDLLDLLVVSVDSGLSLDHALADTARDLASVHPAISEELAVFQVEVRAGTSRADALRNLGRRVREPEMRKLTSLLIQADRFGTSIAKVLRTQARYMRVRRRQRAEELAHKVGVKLIFPIFFLIMPSIFVITAGPALMQLFLHFRQFANY